MCTASWSETLKASSKMALPKLPVTWSLPMPSAIVSYLAKTKTKASQQKIVFWTKKRTAVLF